MQGERMKKIALGIVALFAAGAARADVVESSPSGFALRQTVQIAAAPDKVYAALVQPAKWWSSSHTFSKSAANMSIDAKAGGCFCEIWKGGSVQHALVVYAQPGVALRLRGPFGPFQGQGVDAALTFSMEAKNGGTEFVMEEVTGGFMQGGMGDWGKKADGMLAEQVARLKQYIETGSPEAAH